MDFELYFSLTSHFLFLALKKNDKWLDRIQKENIRLHSENFIFHLQQILERNNCHLSEINKIYFTSQPGGQTGIRVGLAFLATYQVLNPSVKLYHINTLYLQSGTDNCISLLTLDSRASKYYVAVYQNKNCLIATQIITKDEIENLRKRFPNFLLYKDFQTVDFLSNFHQLKNDFALLTNLEEINY